MTLIALLLIAELNNWLKTALLSVTEALRLARAASKSSVLILLDLSAAFDTVNHQILMSILRKMGISGTALLWFESYLSDRSFRVSWRGEVSKSLLLATGVPQGSVLGPLLFSIYMSSLGSVIQKHGFSYHCYADDTQLYFSFQPDDPTVTARIAACLSDISSWMMDHHLQLNLAKTELLVFSANPSLHHNFSIQLGSSTITPSRTARNLGVVIDDQLSFTGHIATTARSCRFALYNIRKIRPFLSEQAACTIKPLQLIQNAAARVVFNEPKKSSRYPSLHQVTLATNSRSHQIQGTDVCLQDHNWHCTNIPKLASSNLCALQKLAFCKWTTPCGAIPKRYQITLTDLFMDCAQLVEWPPDLNSNSWVFSHVQKTSKDTSFSPAPD